VGDARLPTQGRTCHGRIDSRQIHLKGQVIECAFDCSPGHNQKGLLYDGSAEPTARPEKVNVEDDHPDPSFTIF
jgi:hypothetical protein